MKPNPVDWDLFQKRKKIKVSEWLKNKSIKTKEGFVSWCNKNFIKPPEKKSNFWEIFNKKKPQKQKTVIKKNEEAAINLELDNVKPKKEEIIKQEEVEISPPRNYKRKPRSKTTKLEQ